MYTEEKLQKIGRSRNGLCHFCKIQLETLVHLFYGCNVIQELWRRIYNMIQNNARFEGLINLELNEESILLGLNDLNPVEKKVISTLVNTIKWVVWKNRNIIKYQDKQVTLENLVQYSINEIKMLLHIIPDQKGKNVSCITEIKHILNLVSQCCHFTYYNDNCTYIFL